MGNRYSGEGVERVTLIQPQHKGGAFKGPAKGHCLNCMDEQEYNLTVPVNRRDLIHVIAAVKPRAVTLTLYVVQLAGAGIALKIKREQRCKSVL